MAMGDSVPTPRISVHQAFGGGLVADVLLWRKWCGGVVMLASATTFWCLFELAGYSILSFVANVLLLLVVILFFWAKSASLLNRPLPPLPNLEISERTAGKIADELQVWVNIALSIAHDITLGRNLKLLLKVKISLPHVSASQVGVALWFVSFIGSFFSFLTVVYIGVILSLSVPVLYDKYQHHIDEKLSVTNKIIQTQYRKIDETVLRKLPLPSKKEKKMQ
ncbi:reticulon-like protein B11 [Gossypium australe]|uniref:Reticulon-like protein n=1 Tax=Gossypium australe TaxID=47621 RepID=A0A5B6X3A8_9ROSI|nr:reticulon-like protein B11 [Gossypium australe]